VEGLSWGSTSRRSAAFPRGADCLGDKFQDIAVLRTQTLHHGQHYGNIRLLDFMAMKRFTLGAAIASEVTVDEKIGEETYLQRIFTEQKPNNNQKMPEDFQQTFSADPN